MLFVVLVWAAFSNPAGAEEVDVYLFAGQSNMDGRGKAENLTAEQRRPSESVRIFYRNPPHASDGWQPLAPGFSIPPKHKGGVPSGTFGPEIGFAAALVEAEPGKRFGFIKSSEGGTSLREDWRPGTKGKPKSQGACYRDFVETVRLATAALEKEGDSVRIRGLLWHQGESDSKVSAEKHEERLVALAARLREDLGVKDLPIVVGEVFDNGKRHKVRAALRAFSESDAAAELVTVEGLTTWDPGTHFDARSQLELGKRYAAAILKLQKPTEK